MFNITVSQTANLDWYEATCPFPGCGHLELGSTRNSALSRLLRHIGSDHECKFLVFGGQCPCGLQFDEWSRTPSWLDAKNIKHLLVCERFHEDLTLKAMAKLGDAD